MCKCTFGYRSLSRGEGSCRCTPRQSGATYKPVTMLNQGQCWYLQNSVLSHNTHLSKKFIIADRETPRSSLQNRRIRPPHVGELVQRSTRSVGRNKASPQRLSGPLNPIAEHMIPALPLMGDRKDSNARKKTKPETHFRRPNGPQLPAKASAALSPRRT